MKSFCFATAIALATCHGLRAELLLSAGDTYAYSFSSLPFLGSISPVPVGTPNSFSASFVLDGTSIQAGTLFRFELVLDGGGVLSLLWDGAASPANLSAAGSSFSGFVRFTGLNGSVTVESIRMDSFLHAPTIVPTLNHYGATITPVPEPGVVALGGVSVAVLWLVRRKWRARRLSFLC